MDGVLWLGQSPIAGSAEAIEILAANGHEVIFTTNNSFMTRDGYLNKLHSFSIRAEPHQIYSSAMAAANLVRHESLVGVLGGPGVTEALDRLHVPWIRLSDSADQDNLEKAMADSAIGALIVGYHVDFGYQNLSRAISVLNSGARLVATNSDPTYPTPSGLVAGTGALVAAVAYGAQKVPCYAGKPDQPMVDLVSDLVARATGTIVVGDRPSTDGLFSKALGASFALVYSGVTSKDSYPDNDFEIRIDHHAGDLLELVRSFEF